MEPVCVGIHEAALLLTRSRTAIYELLKSGELRSIKSGKRRTIPVTELRRYAARAVGGERHTRIDGQAERVRG
jgi:excisionase family DNA binding protein